MSNIEEIQKLTKSSQEIISNENDTDSLIIKISSLISLSALAGQNSIRLDGSVYDVQKLQKIIDFFDKEGYSASTALSKDFLTGESLPPQLIISWKEMK